MNTADDGTHTTTANADQIDPAMLVEVEHALDGVANPTGIPQGETPAPTGATAADNTSTSIQQAETTEP